MGQVQKIDMAGIFLQKSGHRRIGKQLRLDHQVDILPEGVILASRQQYWDIDQFQHPLIRIGGNQSVKEVAFTGNHVSEKSPHAVADPYDWPLTLRLPDLFKQLLQRMHLATGCQEVAIGVAGISVSQSIDGQNRITEASHKMIDPGIAWNIPHPLPVCGAMNQNQQGLVRIRFWLVMKPPDRILAKKDFAVVFLISGVNLKGIAMRHPHHGYYQDCQQTNDVFDFSFHLVSPFQLMFKWYISPQ
jgi:hypothetical protein